MCSWLWTGTHQDPSSTVLEFWKVLAWGPDEFGLFGHVLQMERADWHRTPLTMGASWMPPLADVLTRLTREDPGYAEAYECVCVCVFVFLGLVGVELSVGQMRAITVVSSVNLMMVLDPRTGLWS